MVEGFFVKELMNTGITCYSLFDTIDCSTGHPVKKLGTKIFHPEWVPEQLVSYAREINGCSYKWRTKNDGSGRLPCTGSFNLNSVQKIYSNWQKELGLQLVSADSRLHQFKVLDLANESMYVGLYYDQAQDPGLYVYEPGEGQQPYPLHVDMHGYVQLLSYSLGYTYWQHVLVELLPVDERKPTNYLEPQAPKFRRDLEAWVPDFNYEAFVNLYHEVKLKGYTPSSW